MKKTANDKSRKQVYMYTTYALMAGLLCIFAPMAVPIGPIPISLTNLVLYIAIFILGTKGTTISFGIYMLLGIVGLPVFSGYAGGVGKLAGPTGGYLVGFFPMIVIMGVIYNLVNGRKLWIDATVTFLGMILGTMVAYAVGTAWFCFQTDCDLMYALGVCVFPFIPFDLAKMVIAGIVGRAVRQPLLKQGLI